MTVVPRSPGRTAVLTAVARAFHLEEPAPRVLDDRLALALAGDEGPVLIKRLRSEVDAEVLLGFSRWVCVRARLPEDVVRRAVANGVRQYVILGAGLDSFAYRHPDLSISFASSRWTEAVLATVAACPAGTRIVLTYNLPWSALREQGLEIQSVLAGIAAEMGEPFVSLFEPAEAEQLVRRLGFAEVVQFGPDEALQTYFAGREDVRLHGAQWMLVATV